MVRSQSLLFILGLAMSGCSSSGSKNTAPSGTSAKTQGQPSPAAPQTKANSGSTGSEKTEGKIECKVKGDVRTLEVRGKGPGCELAYTKAGQENVIGSSLNGRSHCEMIAGRVKDKLLAAGYSCE